MGKSKAQFDYVLLTLTAVLLTTGLAVLWSASTAEAKATFGDTNYFIIHQLTRGVLIGLVLMYIFSKIDYHRLKKPAAIIIVIGLLSLLALKIPGVGFTANGATRWIDFGAFLFQPSELAKLCLIIYLAAWTGKHNRTGNQNFWSSIFPPLAIVGVMAALIVFQPDLGTALAVVAIAMTMFFMGGARLKYLLWSGLGGAILAAGFVIFEPYRMRRITAFLNPSADTLGVSYQINQALIAIGSGGLFGYGYGLSRQKHFYLPEAINDSIFAIMAEELGFVRVSLILLVFAWFIYRGLHISLKAADSFGKMLALGITTMFAVSVLINVGAILGLIPLTGIALPLFSYGSSAMIVNLAAIGILLNISKQHRAISN
ncbi:MAG TPA: putative lipid II flippase FtsW [Candidatus Doudnabacteria bacterium]|nr:putative lipid II flippase FtsW [Candidatus Doudnabacteria bacterium]